jgi:hypothetical protein
MMGGVALADGGVRAVSCVTPLAGDENSAVPLNPVFPSDYIYVDV